MTLRHVNRYYSLRGHEVPFRVVAHLAAPVAFNDYLCLDSLLAYAVVREELGASYWDQGPRDAEPECLMRPPLPLKKCQTRGPTGGEVHVWHASASMLPDGPNARDVLWLKKHWESKPSCEKFAAYSGKGKVDVKAGPFKSWNVPVPTVSVPRLSWHACGDPREALRLLEAFIVSVGKKRNGGLGLVREWSVQETEVDESLVNREGVVQRPIPIRFDRAAAWSMTEIRTYQAPYWLRDGARLCIAVGARRVDGGPAIFGRQEVIA